MNLQPSYTDPEADSPLAPGAAIDKPYIESDASGVQDTSR